MCWHTSNVGYLSYSRSLQLLCCLWFNHNSEILCSQQTPISLSFLFAVHLDLSVFNRTCFVGTWLHQAYRAAYFTPLPMLPPSAIFYWCWYLATTVLHMISLFVCRNIIVVYIIITDIQNIERNRSDFIGVERFFFT